jgi:hypothetical protein
MHRTRSLASLRLTILAAAGLGFGACAEELVNPAPTSAGTTGTTSSTTTTASTTGTGGSTATTTGSGGAGGQAGAGGAGGSGGQGGSGAGFVDPVCEGAMLVLSAQGKPTGFAQCPDSTLHRIEPVACDPTIDAPACSGGESFITCTTDAECSAGPNGRCAMTVQLTDDGLKSFCGCRYSCSSDAECGEGKVCVCGGFLGLEDDWSVCAPASCITGADCPSGECGLSAYYDGCTTNLQLGCRAEGDACRTSDGCTTDGGAFLQCVLPDMSTTWDCKATTCSLGRPLRIDGLPRRAPAVPRGDWMSAMAPRTDGLSAALREALAAHWLEAAALEQASVGSFARFTLELLSLGAPSALVAEAQRAGLDEVEHASLAYGLASAYAGRGLGPGPLSLQGLTLALDRRSILRALIDEGCVGETLAVAEALELAVHAADPLLQAAHQRIAEDEQRHAELAWKTLAWLLEGHDDGAFVACCFAEACAAAGRDPAPRRLTAPEHGLLASSEIGALRRRALREVVEPCAAALLAAEARRAPSGRAPFTLASVPAS